MKPRFLHRTVCCLVVMSLWGCKPAEEESGEVSNYTDPNDSKACGGDFIIPDPDNVFYKTKKNLPEGGIPFYASRTQNNIVGYIAGRAAGSDSNVVIPLTLSDSQCEMKKAASQTTTPQGADGDAPCVYMQVTTDTGVAYEDEYLSRSIARVGKGIPVTRELTKTHDNGKVAMRVNVRGGALQNKVVWIEGSNLGPRDDSSLCPAKSASLSLTSTSPRCKFNIRGGTEADKIAFVDTKFIEPRVQTWPRPECSVELISADHWSNYFGAGETLDNWMLGTGKSALLCIPSLGEGFLKSGGGLISGIGSILKGAANRHWSNMKWTADAVLAIGSTKARQRLAQTWKNDKERFQDGMAITKDAIPALHLYFSHWSQEYNRLSPNQQSVVLCNVMGALAFDVILTIAGVNLAKLAKSGKAGKLSSAITKIDDAAKGIVKLDDTPVDDVIRKGAKALPQGAQQAVARSPKSWTSAGVKEWAEQLFRQCTGAPQNCAGVAPKASRTEVIEGLRDAAINLNRAAADSSLDAATRSQVGETLKAVNTRLQAVRKAK